MNKSEIAEKAARHVVRKLELVFCDALVSDQLRASMEIECTEVILEAMSQGERAIAESQAPQPWGIATSYRDDETGALLWRFDNVAEECGDTEAVIELNAANFRLGTTVQVCEPEPPCDNCGKPTIKSRELCEECRGQS